MLVKPPFDSPETANLAGPYVHPSFKPTNWDDHGQHSDFLRLGFMLLWYADLECEIGNCPRNIVSTVILG